MIIRNCYIENFGTLRERSFQFTDGLNVIKEDNGWGKSTLAVFVKSMFYGMEYKVRSKDLYDRTRYLPWQGGNYGGWLVFENAGKAYKIVRYFGKKNTEDEFGLYDVGTNKISNDYSERIGEELFGIDCDSFERSIFVTLEGKEPVMQDNINAKLNNLIDNTDDINNFENAYGRLDKLSNEIKQKRGTNGRIFKIGEKIAEIKKEISRCEDAENRRNLRQIDIQEQTGERDRLEKDVAHIQEELGKAAMMGRKREYDSLRKRKADKELEIKELEAVFRGKVPSEDEIQENNERARKLQPLLASLEDGKVSQEERNKKQELEIFFNRNRPSRSTLAECQNSLVNYNKAVAELSKYKPQDSENREYERLEKKYRKEKPEPGILDFAMDDYNHVLRLNSKIDGEKARMGYIRKMESVKKSQSKKKKLPLMALGAILAVLGIFLYTKTSNEAGIAIGALGIAMAVLRLFLRGGNSSKESGGQDDLAEVLEKISQLEKERERLEQGYLSLIKKTEPNADLENIPKVLSNMKGEVQQLEALSHKIRTYKEMEQSPFSNLSMHQEILNRFLEPYRKRTEIKDDATLLNVISDNLITLEELKRQIEGYDRIQEAADSLEKVLNPFLQSFDVPEGKNYTDQMEFLRDTFIGCRVRKMERDAIAKQIEEFEKENDILLFESLEEPDRAPEELKRQLEICSDQLKKTIGILTGYQKEWEEQSVLADRCPDLESELEKLQTESRELMGKYRVLQKTMELLGQAKEKLSTGYMDAMTEAFGKYMGMMEGGQKSIQLDADLNTQMEGSGKLWKTDYFSRGYKDLVNVCTRMALVDAMYHAENPFIILDDPFVNLDDNKLTKALEFIKELAKERQVFYFVCQEGRRV